MKQSRTTVLFRYWKGEVIAIFPELSADTNPSHCLSCGATDGHGACDPNYIIATSRPATPEEYQSLFDALSSDGYCLQVRQRRSR